MAKLNNPATEILRVALYIRVSTEEQAMHGISLVAQKDSLLRYAKDRGYKIVGIYRDEGNSARKPVMKRPVMLQLLEDVKAGKIDRILFKMERMRFSMSRKLNKMDTCGTSLKEVWEWFIISKTSKCVSDATLSNYHHHLRAIAKHLDIEMPLEELSKRHLERMVVSMKEAGLAHNTIATYLRVMNTFLRWCQDEGLTNVSMPNLKERETVKETYTDAELAILVARPAKDCDFCEYRNWVIINYLLNSGCRAATLRNIQNRDVDLDSRQVVYRHTKNGRIQVSPLCSQMLVILAEYMAIRRGKPEDYLFCNQYGEMLTENALRLAVAHYNKSRGVQKTSLHLFRHTFAKKYLIDCGGNAFTLQRLLGHSTLTMSKRYCNIYDTDIARDYDTYSPLAKMNQKKERIQRR